MQKIVEFSSTPTLTELSSKERGVRLVAVSVFSIFAMVAFLMKAVSDAADQQLVPFIASLIQGAICAVVGLVCWSKFAQREKAHINDAVETLRKEIQEVCHNAGVVDEDIQEWVLERVWECFCGDLLDASCVAYIEGGAPLGDEENLASVPDLRVADDEVADPRGYVLSIRREGKTARSVLYRA